MRLPSILLGSLPRSSTLAALGLAAALGACHVDDEVSATPSRAAPDPHAEATPPCVRFCELRSNDFSARCHAHSDPAVCEAAGTATRESCTQQQCSLEVELPGTEGLDALAATLASSLLGPQFERVEVIPRPRATAEHGSRVYTFTSLADGSSAFLELGTSLDQPPVLSYGFGAFEEHALDASSTTAVPDPREHALRREGYLREWARVLPQPTARGANH